MVRQHWSFKEILATWIPLGKSQTLILILAIHVVKRATYHWCVPSVLPALTLLALTRRIQKMGKLNHDCLHGQGPGKEGNTSAWHGGGYSTAGQMGIHPRSNWQRSGGKLYFLIIGASNAVARRRQYDSVSHLYKWGEDVLLWATFNSVVSTRQLGRDLISETIILCNWPDWPINDIRIPLTERGQLTRQLED